MAISFTHYQLLKSLQPLLPLGGSLLEIGEANWYGDVSPGVIIEELAGNPDELRKALCSGDSRLFAISKVFYQALFAPSVVHSIDINGTAAALRLDLNQPLLLKHKYDVSINHGTAEHVFNIAQVFRTMHDWTKPGGLMIHEAPCTGWLDHGFYTLQPTLFYDLAAANEYAVELIALEEIASRLIINLEHRDHFAELAQAGRVPMNSMLFVALRRGEGPFRIPMQGYYDQKLSAAGNQAWETLR